MVHTNHMHLTNVKMRFTEPDFGLSLMRHFFVHKQQTFVIWWRHIKCLFIGCPPFALTPLFNSGMFVFRHWLDINSVLLFSFIRELVENYWFEVEDLISWNPRSLDLEKAFFCVISSAPMSTNPTNQMVQGLWLYVKLKIVQKRSCLWCHPKCFPFSCWNRSTKFHHQQSLRKFGWIPDSRSHSMDFLCFWTRKFLW